MATEVDRKTWVTIVDVLRFSTPALLGLLSFCFFSFQSTLEANTVAVNELKTAIAVMGEKQLNTNEMALENRRSIQELSGGFNDSKRQLDNLSVRFASIERGKQ